MWYVTGSNRSHQARCVVPTASGPRTVVVDPTQSGRQWLSLGVFTLDPTTTAVRLSNEGGSGVVIADAVRCQPQ